MKDGKPEFTAEQLQAALGHIGHVTANMACPCCGTRKWTVETEGMGGLLSPLLPFLAYIPFTAAPFFGPAPVIPSIVLSCDECGFVRHHNVPHILKRLGVAG